MAKEYIDVEGKQIEVVDEEECARLGRWPCLFCDLFYPTAEEANKHMAAIHMPEGLRTH